MRYRAFGLVIESDVALPELPAATGDPDWRVFKREAIDTASFTRYHTIVDAIGKPWLFYSRDGDRYLIEYPDYGQFVVNADATIEVIAATAPAETLQHLIVDQVLPIAIAHHGELVLHAAAVEWDGKAVVFVGRSGQGKSTLAAACVARGAALIADDAVVVRGTPAAPVTAVSYGGLRLWRDSGAMYDVSTEPTYVAHYSDKRRVTMRAGSSGALPIAAIFALEAGEQIEVTPLAPRDALMLLLANTYRLETVESAPLRREFASLQQLVSSFPVRRLRYPRRYEALDEVAGALRNDNRYRISGSS